MGNQLKVEANLEINRKLLIVSGVLLWSLFLINFVSHDVTVRIGLMSTFMWHLFIRMDDNALKRHLELMGWMGTDVLPDASD